MSSPLHNENELLVLVSKGDEAAFREVYNFYQKKIFALGYTLTESVSITEEVVQEAFIKVWHNRRKLSEVTNFNAWLRAITKNLIIDAVKKQAKENVGKQTMNNFTQDYGDYADDIILSREHERLLEDAITLLTPQQKIVYNLRRKEGLKNAEIAEKLDISILTVKNHLISAIRIIRNYFRQNATIILLAFLFSFKILLL